MQEPTGKLVSFPQESSRDVLTQILHDGACEMLATAIRSEVQDYVAAREHLVDAASHRLVVRNGHLPERTIQTPLGDVPVKQPRVRDRRPAGERESFQSSILPPYLRKTKSIEELLPWLYLKGVSTGDFSEALAALLGADAPGLSASTITRMKACWEQEFKDWQHRSLAGKRYVYLWADGIYFNIRLEDPGNARQCILVLMGATTEGRKELVAVSDGYRESEQSWTELLLDVQARGVTIDPKLATADRALGFWNALAKVFPTTRVQNCWVHKTANVLNKMPKGVQGKAKSMLHDIWMAETKAAAEEAFDLFGETFRAKYDGAVTGVRGRSGHTEVADAGQSRHQLVLQIILRQQETWGGAEVGGKLVNCPSNHLHRVAVDHWPLLSDTTSQVTAPPPGLRAARSMAKQVPASL